ncbi:mitochondrial carrier protein [Nitzschia inconspicua]|uniref:Mitochondrial carrier protein n=1 Tax=Nitzschia inconspicua TaxID=303405 RepID=A0A9K3PZQ7_9STRA|nr:mitochondrial carrier protein [Nitzschia inconspicua]
MSSNNNKTKNPLTAMTAGCIAGGVEATAVWPMEYIKTQLQLQSKVKVGGTPLPYNGMVSGLTYTVRTTGFFSLYRGLAPTLLGSIPKAGIRFGLNSVIKDALRDKDGKLTPGKNFLAGLGAGVSEAIIIVAPVETVKTKCIELNMPFLKGLKHIVSTEGIGGVYQGAFATALKQGSNQGLRFMWFNEYKNYVTDDGAKPMTPILGLLGGMSAGCFSTLGNNPFDVVKTRMQGTKASQYTSTLDCFQQILAKEGVSALYAGVVPRLGRVVPGQGIIFMSFETIQSTLETNFDVFK